MPVVKVRAKCQKPNDYRMAPYFKNFYFANAECDWHKILVDEYNAVRVTNRYIYFEAETDAIRFVLKWS